MTKLSVPLVHLNGSGRKLLGEGLRDVYDALTEALTIMARNRPHGRDYYPKGPDACTQASNAWEERIEALISMQREILEVFEAIEDQGK